MKLISCNSCGVLLDHDRLRFPEDMWTEEAEIDSTKAAYGQDRGDYFSFVPCLSGADI